MNRSLRLSSRSKRLQSGFTLVELMIATMVFSVILLVITYGVVRFTNSYYKGLNSSTTNSAGTRASSQKSGLCRISRSRSMRGQFDSNR